MDMKKAYRDTMKLVRDIDADIQHKQFIEKKCSIKNPMKPIKGNKFNSSKFSNKPRNLNRRTGR